MRIVATSLLAMLAVLLAVSIHWQRRYPALEWLRAFAEAGLVGGLADWFAVVALFRHPLGLPLPHTAILQRNKDRMGREFGGFIRRNFLTSANVTARLAALDLAGSAARWCGRPANATTLAAGCTKAIPQILSVFDDSKIEAFVTSVVRHRAEQLDAVELARAALGSLIEHNLHQQALDKIIQIVGTWLDANRTRLSVRFGNQTRWTPKWIDSYVVDKFVDAVIDLVDEVRAAPEHELRGAFDTFAHELILRLGEDAAIREQVDRLRQDLLARLDIERFVSLAWRELKRRLVEPGAAPVHAWVEATILRYAALVREDETLRTRLNQALLLFVEAAVDRAGRQVALLVTDVFERWNAREAASRIELEVGSDLQFIRINGSLIGGAAGLVIHAAVVWWLRSIETGGG